MKVSWVDHKFYFYRNGMGLKVEEMERREERKPSSSKLEGKRKRLLEILGVLQKIALK